ncbi:DMT family transporter [Phyllobacterium sp. 22229]|uniref:DMT family transporter n=1 Tax=Phyllobacterium sp. 22229 TaxID=3453895 RepID=UPI003F82CE3A
MRARSANTLLLVTAAIWGIGFIGQSSAMTHIGPFTFIFFRFLFASLTISPLMVREVKMSRTSLTSNECRLFLFTGMALFAAVAFQQSGLVTATVTNTGFLTGLNVVFVPILAIVLFGQYQPVTVWLAALTAFTGIYLLSDANLENLNGGDWLIVACAFFWALQVVFVGRAASAVNRPITLSLFQFIVCGILGLVVALFTEEFNAGKLMMAAPALLFVGVVSTGVAFTLQTISQRFTSASQAAISLSSEALFAAFFGRVILGEQLSCLRAIGCGLIFLAMIASQLNLVPPAPSIEE